jgi:glycosyltransferase involved in cell wall biosynthesis
MRIVFVAYNFKPAEKDAQQWLKRIDFFTGIPESLSSVAEVVNIDFINTSCTLEQNGVRYVFPERGFSTLFNGSLFVKKLLPDVVLVQGFRFSLHCIFLRMLLGKRAKIILCHHAERPGGVLNTWLLKIADRYISGYLFATKEMSEPWIIKKIISTGKKIYAAPEASSVYSPVDKHIAKEKMNIKGDKVFLWVGRLNRNKDPLTAVRAFSDYAKKYPSAKLYMIYQEDDLLPGINALITKNNVSGNIILIGKVSREDLLYWFSASDFIINASFYEGCNISVLEGMSCGCIPIVTNIASFKLHTSNGSIGFQFKPGNAGQLLQALMQTDKIDLEAERLKVLEYFREHLSFKAIAKKIHGIITAV